MKTAYKLLLATIVLVPTLALAQTHRHQNVHPVPAPTLSIAHEERGKEVSETEEEGPPGPVSWWDNKVLNNPHVPYGAMLINFALLVFIYYRFGKKPVAEGLKNRKVSIASAIENAQKILGEARQRSKKYRAQLEKVEGSAEIAKQNEIAVGQGQSEMILRVADEKADRLKRDVAFILDQEQKQTKADLVRETVEMAAKEAEELLKKSVSAADQERLAEEFISKLAADYAKGLPLGGGAS
jgi:F-type H+-transporting ATPase subunit b